MMVVHDRDDLAQRRKLLEYLGGYLRVKLEQTVLHRRKRPVPGTNCLPGGRHADVMQQRGDPQRLLRIIRQPHRVADVGRYRQHTLRSASRVRILGLHRQRKRLQGIEVQLAR